MNDLHDDASAAAAAGPDSDSPAARSQDLRAGIERRLNSLEEHSIPQLQHCNGPLDLHAELVEGIRQDVSVIEAQLEDLSLLAEEAPTERLRSSILQAADFLSARLSRARVRAREETLKSKRRIDSSNASSQREALFGTARGSAGRSSSQSATTPASTSKDDELMNATANVTDGLRKTRQLLEQELERSSMSTQILERSSQTLTLTSDQYTSFSGLLNASKNLITTMQKADTLDRLLILAALLFFGLVCVLIVKRRIIDRGVRAATLFSRIAGAGSAPIRNAMPSNIKVPSSSLASASSVVKATVQEISQSGSSLLASVAASATASATMAAASLIGTSVPIPLSPSQPMATLSQDTSQSMQLISEEPIAIASVSSFLKTELPEASLDATAVPIILAKEVVDGDQVGEVVDAAPEKVSASTAARHDHVMDEL